MLNQQADLLLNLLLNSNILENDAFTEAVQAVAHLKEELNYRDELVDIPNDDRNHLSNDLNRVYNSLTMQWLDYVERLNSHHPYLYSLAARVNPFNIHHSAVIKH